MSSVQSLFVLLKMNTQHLSKNELLFLEAEIFIRICQELKEKIREQNKNYFQTIKYTTETENAVLEIKFIRCIVNDILSTEDYSLPGVALYTNTPEEVIYEIASGANTNPTFILSRKLIELHRTVRPHLYQSILEKIKDEL